MLGIAALDQRHRLSQHGAVALADALDILGGRQLRLAFALQVRVDDGRLFHAAVDLQPGKLVIILGMTHAGALLGVLYDSCFI